MIYKNLSLLPLYQIRVTFNLNLALRFLSANDCFLMHATKSILNIPTPSLHTSVHLFNKIVRSGFTISSLFSVANDCFLMHATKSILNIPTPSLHTSVHLFNKIVRSGFTISSLFSVTIWIKIHGRKNKVG